MKTIIASRTTIGAGGSILNPATVTIGGVAYAFALAADGVTDDTALLQAAIDSGDTIVLPRGQILVSSIDLNTTITMRGQGIGETHIVPTAHQDCVRLNVGGGTKVHNIQLSNFSLFPTTDRTAGAALHLGNVGSVHVANVKIGNSLGGRPFEGLRCDEVSDSAFDFLRISGCVSHNAIIEAAEAGDVCVELAFAGNCVFNASQEGHGMLLKNTFGGGASVEGIHIAPGCVFYNNALDNIHIQCDTGATMQGIHLEGAIIDTGGRDGLRTSGTAAAGSIKYLLVKNCWSSANVGIGINLTSVVKDFWIDNGNVQLNGAQGVLLTGAVRGHILNVCSEDNSQTTTQTDYGIELAGACEDIQIFGGSVGNTGNATNKQHGLLVGASVTDSDAHGLRMMVLSGQTPYTISATAGEFRLSHYIETDNIQHKSWGQYVVSGTGSNKFIRWVSDANENNRKSWRMNAGTLELLNSAENAVVLSIDNTGNMDINAAFLEMLEMTAPAAPGANGARLFIQDNGAGKTQLAVIFPTGAIQVIATEP